MDGKEAKPFVYDFNNDDLEVQAQLRGWGNTVLSELYTADENIVYSPLSLEVALAMVANGASEEGVDQIASLLQLDGAGLEKMNSYVQKLVSGLTGGCDPKVLLTLANSVWIQKEIQLYSFFEQNMKEIFGADVRLTDFKNNLSAAKDEINRWADKTTNGQIKEVNVPIDNTTAFVLSNSGYFYGKWNKPFKEEKTSREPFFNASGQETAVDMMHQVERNGYYQGDHYEMARLQYGNSSFSMLIALPHEGEQLSEVIGDINWTAETIPVELTLSLPRFKVTRSMQLNDALKSLGVKSVYEELPQMSATELHVSGIYQDAFIQVDESGAKAAAVTTATGMVGSVIKEHAPVTMVVNRPFAFAIYDVFTGTVLFEGCINRLQ